MNKKIVNRHGLFVNWALGLVFLAGLSVSSVWGQERWKTYVKGPGATRVIGCLYQIDNTILTFAANDPTPQYVNVETHSGCVWAAKVVDATKTWVHVVGEGNRVRIEVDPIGGNTARWADVAVAGFMVRVQQNSADSTPVSPLSLALEGYGGYALKGIHVIPTDTLTRSAAAVDPWLSVLSGCCFSSEAWVLIEAQPNNTGRTRTGSIQVAGRWVTVTQPALPIE